MRALVASFICSLLCLTATTTEKQVHPRPPGLRDGDKQINKPLDPPLVAGPAAPDPLKLKQEAVELAQLSAQIPTQIEFLGKGQLPKNLIDQLKSIEKLAKHLRSEITP